MALKQDEYKIIVTALDKTKGAFSGIEGSLKSFGSSITNVQNLFRGLLASAPFLAIADMIRKTANAGEELLKMSKQTGITTENLSLLKYAAEISETSIEDLNVGMRAFSNALAGTNEEGKDTTLLLKSLGVTAKDPFEALKQVSNALKGIDDASSVSAISVELFGRSGRDLIPMLLELSEALEEAKKNAHIFSEEDARAADTFNDNITRLKANLISLRNDAVAPLIGSFNELFARLGYSTKSEEVKTRLKDINSLLNEYQQRLQTAQKSNWVDVLLGGDTDSKAIEERIKSLKKERESLINELIQPMANKFVSEIRGEQGPAPIIPWDPKKVEEHFKGIWADAEKGIKQLVAIKDQMDKAMMTPIELIRKQADEWIDAGQDRIRIEKWVIEETKKETDKLLKIDIDVAKARIDSLKEWKDYIVEIYNTAIAKAQEYYASAASIDTILKHGREWLENLDKKPLSLEDQMESDKKDIQKMLKEEGFNVWNYEQTEKTMSAIETFINKYKGTQDVFGFEIDFSGIKREYGLLLNKIDMMKQNIEQAGISWEKSAATMAENIYQIELKIYDLKMQLENIVLQLDVSPALQSALYAKDYIDKILPDVIKKTISFNIEGLSNEGVTSSSYAIGPGNIGMPLEGWLEDIKSFQGLTSPIEFQRPSFIQVHPGEKLYPAGKTDINFSPTIYVNGAKDPEASAKEIDSKLADMWQTRRSKLRRAMNN